MVPSGDRLLPIALSFSGTLGGAFLACFFSQTLTRSKSGILVAMAAGMMIGCCFVLISECASRCSWLASQMLLGLGVALMAALDGLCSRLVNEATFEFSGVSGKPAVRVLIMLLGLLMHSAGEGLSLGLSAAESSSTSSIVASSLALHNVPETAALLISYRAKGLSDRAAILLAILSSLPQSLVAFPASEFFIASKDTIQYGMGLSAGCMLYAVVSDIFPEAQRSLGRVKALWCSLFASIMIILFDSYSHIQIR